MTSKRTGKLRHATISDVHLNHPRVPTIWILRSLFLAIMGDESSKDLDYIWFAGDVWDRIAQLPQEEVVMLHCWLDTFLSFCYENNIRIRIVEGTPSHDRKQSRFFVDVNNLLKDKKADLRYFDHLCIDYEEEFDFHVLYVPDEWRHDPDVTWGEVLDELRTNGIDQVEIAVMHGTMDFQVPKFMNIPGVHDANRYADITKWFVTIGHQHTCSSFRNIYAQGSLDRLSQNEEEDKGHFRFLVDMDKDVVIPEFIVNHNAMPHRDVDVTDLEFEEAFKRAVEVAEDVLKLNSPLEVRYYGFIRLSMTEKHYTGGLLSGLKEKFPQLSWDRKIITEKKKGEENDSMNFELDEVIVMNETNAVGLIEAELDLLDVDPSLKSLAKSLIEDVTCVS